MSIERWTDTVLMEYYSDLKVSEILTYSTVLKTLW